ncbi:hypothetical protein [Enterococcus sp. AZ101]|uniref:hypothetical protein n=1 Tax=Enterococcus sp. AZ101 TaxID=2774742 RepID=UPI003D2BBE5D
MKKMGKKVVRWLKRGRGKSYLLFFVWLLFMGWASCRIYADVKLDQFQKNTNNEQVVFLYEDEKYWSGLDEVKEILEQDFLKIAGHISVTHQKDALLNLKAGHILMHGFSTTMEYKETIPYKIAYFYQLFSKDSFKKNSWTDSQEVQYLDVLGIASNGQNSYKVTISENDIATIKENKEKILTGKVKVRARNFEDINYRELEDKSFYTYLKNEQQKNSPYTYLYVEKQQRDAVESTILSLRYVVNEAEVVAWNNVFETIDLYGKNKFIAQYPNNQMKETINARKSVSTAPKGDAISNATDIQDLVEIKRLDTGQPLLSSDFYQTDQLKWFQYMADPNKKAKAVREIVISLDKQQKTILFDKYAYENNTKGRKELNESQKRIKQDISEQGKESIYYKWLSELNLYDSDEGELIVDFGNGIVNEIESKR